MTSTNDVYCADFVSLLDEEFRGGTSKDRMPLELRRKRFAARFAHTRQKHAAAALAAKAASATGICCIAIYRRSGRR
jgi:hypothetical protein